MQSLSNIRSGRTGFLAALLLCALVPLSPFVANPLLVSYERLTLLFLPSADQAFAYGSFHLDHAHPFFYSLDDATYFYRKVAAIDPQYPYVQHQLARIYFLRGDFDLALVHINAEIERYGEEHMQAYYMRGLILGFRGEYTKAAIDYEHFLQKDPDSWAAINDYAWVLLKAERYEKAENILTKGIERSPDSPWLLNSLAIAKYELREYQAAYDAVQKASDMLPYITEKRWSTAYPGNDPKVAREGLRAFKEAVEKNMHMIEEKLDKDVLRSD